MFVKVKYSRLNFKEPKRVSYPTPFDIQWRLDAYIPQVPVKAKGLMTVFFKASLTSLFRRL